MKLKATNDFICPCGPSLLKLTITNKEPDGEVISGSLECKDCGITYPIINGIPRFVPKSNYADSFGFQWNLYGKTQLDSYTGRAISKDRVFLVTGWPERMEGQRILEAGSGAGRFTEILLATGADLFSFDYSSAVDANRENNAPAHNLTLFQGDIYNIPLYKHSFDKVFCLGVIQHTPNPEQAFKSLSMQVRPGGELVIDVYTKRFISLLQWKYLLRPITKRIDKKRLHRVVSAVVPFMLPAAILFRRIAGQLGAKLVPVAEFSSLELPYELHKQWSVLDTFDWYAPAHDHPQSIVTVQRWYQEAGFVDIKVDFGPNGIIAKGRQP